MLIKSAKFSILKVALSPFANLYILPWPYSQKIKSTPAFSAASASVFVSPTKKGSMVILNKINLDIRKGEILGLIGDSGSGKSMLGLALMDMIPKGCSITNGSVNHYFDSHKDLSSLRGIKSTLITQDPMHALNPLQTIGTQFGIVLTKRYGYDKKKTKQHVINWIEKVSLHNVPNILGRYPHQLSGGQMQRAMIAMAMSVSPDFIIADEITTGLDSKIKMEILNLLFSLQKDVHFSTLLISHDLNTVQKYCDRIAVLKSGEIIYVDDTKTVIEKTESKYIKTLSKNFTKTFGKKRKKKLVENQNPILYVNRLCKTYGRKKHTVYALKDITFEVYRGETLGLIGESGSGKTTLVKTTLNILETLTLKDVSQNIRVLDGDTIKIPRNNKPFTEQISIAMKSNINPKFINVAIAGRVENPGQLTLNKTATLNEAIVFSGGLKVLKGPIVFLRYQNDGKIDRRKFRYSRYAKAGTYKNPFLNNGDLIVVSKGRITQTSEVIAEITQPLQGIFTSVGFYKILTED